MGRGMEMELITIYVLIHFTLALKMEAVCSSEMLAYSQNTTQCNNLEDHHLFLKTSNPAQQMKYEASTNFFHYGVSNMALYFWLMGHIGEKIKFFGIFNFFKN
jgi:hypothetical protein